MKVYFIDKTGKNLRIKNEIEDYGIKNIETKDTYKFRCAKNDYVIVSEYVENEPDNDALLKYNNLVFLIDNASKEIIWELVNKYQVVDVISSKCEERYIAERITKLIKE